MEQTRIHFNNGKEISVTIKDKTLRCVRTKYGMFSKKADVIAFANKLADTMGIELGQIEIAYMGIIERYKPNGKKYR